jgi:acylphosphatase
MALHLRISGLVQGVGYRYGFSTQARMLNLSGWVRNRRDGSVEALVAGAPDALERITAWARRGPAGSQVSDVEVVQVDDSMIPAPGFDIRSTE